MERRDFIKGLIVPAILPSVLCNSESFGKSSLKEQIILPNDFDDHIRYCLDMRSYSRRILSTYNHDEDFWMRIPRPFQSFENIASFKGDIKKTKYLLESIKNRFSERIKYKEDENLVNYLEQIYATAIFRGNFKKTFYETEFFSMTVLTNAIASFQVHKKYEPCNILMNTKYFLEFFNYTKNVNNSGYIYNSVRDVDLDRVFGTFFNMPILVSHKVPENTAYVFSNPEDVGCFDVKYSPTTKKIEKNDKVEITSKIKSSYHIKTDDLAFRKIVFEKKGWR